MRPLVLVFCLAVAVRLGAQLAFGAYSSPELWEYETIANNLLAGLGYTYATGGITYVASVSSPLYVLLTAGVYSVSAHNSAVMLALQALLGGLTAVLVAWLATRACSTEAGLAAGVPVAIDPALAVYSAKLHPLTLDALGFVAVACGVVALPSGPTWRHTAMVGVVLGLTALTRTTALMFVPLVLVWARLFRGLRLISVPAAVFVLTTLLVYSPWPVRNSVLLGQPVLGSSESAEWLWRGTNPSANGSSLLPDGRTMLQAAPPEFQTRVQNAGEAERMQVYQAAALDFVRQRPFDAALLYLAKLRTFWWASDVTGQTYPEGWVMLYAAWYAAVLGLAAWGAWSIRTDPEGRAIAGLVVAMLILISAAQAVFYVEGRHRLAVEPLLLVLSGVGLSSLMRIAANALPQRGRALRDA